MIKKILYSILTIFLLLIPKLAYAGDIGLDVGEQYSESSTKYLGIEYFRTTKPEHPSLKSPNLANNVKVLAVYPLNCLEDTETKGNDFVNRVAGNPHVDAVEIGNEPNIEELGDKDTDKPDIKALKAQIRDKIDTEYGGMRGDFDCHPNMFADEVTRIYNQIKALKDDKGNPRNIKVVLGGLFIQDVPYIPPANYNMNPNEPGNFVTPYIEAVEARFGDTQPWDIMGLHFYVNEGGDKGDANYIVDKYSKYLPSIRQRIENLPIWVTEYGWRSAYKNMDENRQAEFITEASQWMKDNVEMAFLYSEVDTSQLQRDTSVNNNSTGIYRSNHTFKPSFFALKNVVGKLTSCLNFGNDSAGCTQVGKTGANTCRMQATCGGTTQSCVDPSQVVDCAAIEAKNAVDKAVKDAADSNASLGINIKEGSNDFAMSYCLNLDPKYCNEKVTGDVCSMQSYQIEGKPGYKVAGKDPLCLPNTDSDDLALQVGSKLLPGAFKPLYNLCPRDNQDCKMNVLVNCINNLIKNPSLDINLCGKLYAQNLSKPQVINSVCTDTYEVLPDNYDPGLCSYRSSSLCIDLFKTANAEFQKCVYDSRQYAVDDAKSKLKPPPVGGAAPPATSGSCTDVYKNKCSQALCENIPPCTPELECHAINNCSNNTLTPSLYPDFADFTYKCIDAANFVTLCKPLPAAGAATACTITTTGIPCDIKSVCEKLDPCIGVVCTDALACDATSRDYPERCLKNNHVTLCKSSVPATAVPPTGTTVPPANTPTVPGTATPGNTVTTTPATVVPGTATPLAGTATPLAGGTPTVPTKANVNLNVHVDGALIDEQVVNVNVVDNVWSETSRDLRGPGETINIDGNYPTTWDGLEKDKEYIAYATVLVDNPDGSYTIIARSITSNFNCIESPNELTTDNGEKIKGCIVKAGVPTQYNLIVNLPTPPAAPATAGAPAVAPPLAAAPGPVAPAAVAKATSDTECRKYDNQIGSCHDASCTFYDCNKQCRMNAGDLCNEGPAAVPACTDRSCQIQQTIDTYCKYSDKEKAKACRINMGSPACPTEGPDAYEQGQDGIDHCIRDGKFEFEANWTESHPQNIKQQLKNENYGAVVGQNCAAVWGAHHKGQELDPTNGTACETAVSTIRFKNVTGCQNLPPDNNPAHPDLVSCIRTAAEKLFNPQPVAAPGQPAAPVAPPAARQPAAPPAARPPALTAAQNQNRARRITILNAQCAAYLGGGTPKADQCVTDAGIKCGDPYLADETKFTECVVGIAKPPAPAGPLGLCKNRANNQCSQTVCENLPTCGTGLTCHTVFNCSDNAFSEDAYPDSADYTDKCISRTAIGDQVSLCKPLSDKKYNLAAVVNGQMYPVYSDNITNIPAIHLPSDTKQISIGARLYEGDNPLACVTGEKLLLYVSKGSASAQFGLLPVTDANGTEVIQDPKIPALENCQPYTVNLGPGFYTYFNIVMNNSKYPGLKNPKVYGVDILLDQPPLHPELAEFSCKTEADPNNPPIGNSIFAKVSGVGKDDAVYNRAEWYLSEFIPSAQFAADKASEVTILNPHKIGNNCQFGGTGDADCADDKAFPKNPDGTVKTEFKDLGKDKLYLIQAYAYPKDGSKKAIPCGWYGPVKVSSNTSLKNNKNGSSLTQAANTKVLGESTSTMPLGFSFDTNQPSIAVIRSYEGETATTLEEKPFSGPEQMIVNVPNPTKVGRVEATITTSNSAFEPLYSKTITVPISHPDITAPATPPAPQTKTQNVTLTLNPQKDKFTLDDTIDLMATTDLKVDDPKFVRLVDDQIKETYSILDSAVDKKEICVTDPSQNCVYVYHLSKDSEIPLTVGSYNIKFYSGNSAVSSDNLNFEVSETPQAEGGIVENTPQPEERREIGATLNCSNGEGGDLHQLEQLNIPEGETQITCAKTTTFNIGDPEVISVIFKLPSEPAAQPETGSTTGPQKECNSGDRRTPQDGKDICTPQCGVCDDNTAGVKQVDVCNENGQWESRTTTECSADCAGACQQQQQQPIPDQPNPPSTNESGPSCQQTGCPDLTPYCNPDDNNLWQCTDGVCDSNRSDADKETGCARYCHKIQDGC